MDRRSPRSLAALGFSAAVHLLFLILLIVARQTPPPRVEEPAKVIVVELAALGKPEAPEAAPPPPPAPEEKAPPPVAEAAPPPPPPMPEIEAPKLPETPPAKEPEPVVPPQVKAVPRPLRKPEPMVPPVAETPPEAPPQPESQPAPPAVAQPAPEPAPAAETPRKGIETGVASGTSQEDMNRYVTTLFTMIDAKKVYPRQSMQRHEEGTVVMRLKLAADGTLIEATSPTEEPRRLVEASLDAARRAVPFPPLPASLKQGEATFEVPVVYKLQ